MKPLFTLTDVAISTNKFNNTVIELIPFDSIKEAAKTFEDTRNKVTMPFVTMIDAATDATCKQIASLFEVK